MEERIMTAQPVTPAKLTKAGHRILESSCDPRGYWIKDGREFRAAKPYIECGYLARLQPTGHDSIWGTVRLTAAGLARLESEKGKRNG